MYVANSDSPLTYEEWLASIKGDKGDSIDITISDDGYLVINGIKTNYSNFILLTLVFLIVQHGLNQRH